MCSTVLWIKFIIKQIDNIWNQSIFSVLYLVLHFILIITTLHSLFFIFHFFLFHHITGSDVKQKKGATNILYGMDSGALSSVTVLPDGTHTHQWTVEDPIKRSQITCMYCTCSFCTRYLVCIISLTHEYTHIHTHTQLQVWNFST